MDFLVENSEYLPGAMSHNFVPHGLINLIILAISTFIIYLAAQSTYSQLDMGHYIQQIMSPDT